MPKAEIKVLVNALGADLVDDAAFERNLAVAQLELSEGPARLRARVVPLDYPANPEDADFSLFTLPDEMVNLRSVFYDSRILDDADQQQMRSMFGTAWRDVLGAPFAFVREEESERTVRLVPVPTQASELPLIPLWSPLGADYALNAVMVIASEFSHEPPAMLEWLDLWAALEVLARSAAEDSPRRDMEMAEAFGAAASGLRMLLGV